jgi:hypothetical protein
MLRTSHNRMISDNQLMVVQNGPKTSRREYVLMVHQSWISIYLPPDNLVLAERLWFIESFEYLIDFMYTAMKQIFLCNNIDAL